MRRISAVEGKRIKCHFRFMHPTEESAENCISYVKQPVACLFIRSFNNSLIHSLFLRAINFYCLELSHKIMQGSEVSLAVIRP